MKEENRYIGDDAIVKFLEHYNCPTFLEVVKMKFAGAICSPNLELRPTDVISSFWPEGKEPRLETKKEADLFFKFFMGLWDEVFSKIKANKIKLSAVSIKKPEALAKACQKRHEEIELGYIEGFWGGKDTLNIPGYVAEMIDSLSELSNIYIVLAKKLDNKIDIEEINQNFIYTDKVVEKAINFLIENAVLPRIEEITRVVN